MAGIHHLLYTALGLLMVTAVLELAFISSMVSWLHRTAHGTIDVRADNDDDDDDSSSTFRLAWKPLHLLVDQGHAANGVAGTSLIVVGIGGILVLWLRSRTHASSSRFAAILSRAWIAATVLSCIYATAALGYLFALESLHDGQTIDVSVARGLDGDGAEKYPVDTWTPQGWFAAVLKLDLVDAGVRTDIEKHLRLMRGWEFNLIAVFVVHVVLTVTALVDGVQRRRQRPEPTQYSNVRQKAPVSSSQEHSGDENGAVGH